MPEGADAATAYLHRLAVAARRPPGLAALRDLVSRHLERVPFENLDIVAGVERSLATAAVVQKVALEGRGGFCYELNEAFRWLLSDLGYTVRRIEARVWQADAQRFGAPFDHLALVVTLPEGDFLVDVGFGDGQRLPLRLPRDRLEDVSGRYSLEPLAGGFWRLSSQYRVLYDMTVTAQSLAAFEPMYRHHRSSPESPFSRGLICTRATPSGRITLTSRRLSITTGGQRVESDVDDVTAALREHFSIDSLQ